MTFKFIHDGEEHEIKLTNGLIMDAEENFGAPLDGMMRSSGGRVAFMVKAKLAIYVAILNTIARSTADYSLATTMSKLEEDAEFDFSDADVNTNCLAFFNAVMDQCLAFKKISPKTKGKKKQK